MSSDQMKLLSCFANQITRQIRKYEKQQTEMNKTFATIGNTLRTVIDFFYPPFQKYMTLQLFRYGLTGTVNLLFDWVLYFLIYNFVLQHEMLNLGIVTLSSHIAAMTIKMPVVLISGFLLQKYVTYSSSNLRGRIQLFRYTTVFLINIIINYLGLKILVDRLDFWPTPSNMIVSILTIFISYFSQKLYIFKMPTDDIDLTK
jgi:putative flippase GtrA